MGGHQHHKFGVATVETLRLEQASKNGDITDTWKLIELDLRSMVQKARDPEGLARVGSKEKDNHKQGRTGAETKKLMGNIRIQHHNPTQSGGINRATRGTGAGSKEY